MSDTARLQELLNEIRTKKRRAKEIKQAFKDELAQHERFAKVKEELETLKAERKSIENSVREGSPKESAELEDLATEIKADEELLSDLAMNLIMKNETVELVDEEMNRYVPELVVKFKKDGFSTSKES
ncbi:hypothetical protein A2856_01535 [Candidatus Uhrbacteria bacterium RIFCSPHIGHO2_01_FULL_63_20]|uniref:Uncharacterized protein n=1 Tax=Candidatus Uhrbacteria bacterium RIFCSPHIGHO2_01_FULL_63_20 TaxID=1802385 RepID=A0A1F7TK55_9BACT|nr:MAG: hypothetical protein A2856_01535 [Candidatus Uhrbacteria bacterium RIFCSPHIGHO2_01_FULL_63_20]